MEWRIILPIVCVLGILLVPGSTAVDSNATATNTPSTNATATNTPSTNATATNTPSTNATATNTPSTNATATNTPSTNATATNTPSTNATATNTPSSNATATNTPSTNATATNTPSTNATATNTPSTNATATNTPSTNATTTAVTEYNITFHIDQTFKAVYANLSDPETITLKENVTSQIESVYRKVKNFRHYNIRKFRNGSIVTDGVLEFNPSDINPNASDLVKVLVDAVASGNLTIQIKNDSIVSAPVTTVTPSITPNTSQINVTFSINMNFTDALSNLSSLESINLTNVITAQFVTVFKRRYANTLRMLIRKFSKGSVKAECALEFDNNNGSVPTAKQVVDIIVAAVKDTNITVPIDVKTIIATDSSGSATATNETATNATTAVTEYNITFHIDQTFEAVYANLSDPQTITLKENVTSQIESVYRKFKNFRRYNIRKFRNGSIVTDGVLEFNTSNINPNASELAKVLVDAVASGNLTIQIKNETIKVSDPATTVTPSITPNTSQINVTFSINMNFTDALSNFSSPESINLTNNITTQFVTVFKRRYANTLRMLIRQFSKGSVKVESALEFDNNNGSVPKAKEMLDFLVGAANNGSFTFPIDVKSITATDSSGSATSVPTGSSPVNFTMFTALLMTLASLLLSGVMHL